MTIRSRLSLGFSMIILIVAGMGASLCFMMHTMGNEMEGILERSFGFLTKAASAEHAVLQTLLADGSTVLFDASHTDDMVKEKFAALALRLTQLKHSEELIQKPEVVRRITDISVASEQFSRALQELRSSVQKEKTEERLLQSSAAAIHRSAEEFSRRRESAYKKLEGSADAVLALPVSFSQLRMREQEYLTGRDQKVLEEILDDLRNLSAAIEALRDEGLQETEKIVAGTLRDRFHAYESAFLSWSEEVKKRKRWQLKRLFSQFALRTSDAGNQVEAALWEYVSMRTRKVLRAAEQAIRGRQLKEEALAAQLSQSVWLATGEKDQLTRSKEQFTRLVTLCAQMAGTEDGPDGTALLKALEDAGRSHLDALEKTVRWGQEGRRAAIYQVTRSREDLLRSVRVLHEGAWESTQAMERTIHHTRVRFQQLAVAAVSVVILLVLLSLLLMNRKVTAPLCLLMQGLEKPIRETTGIRAITAGSLAGDLQGTDTWKKDLDEASSSLSQLASLSSTDAEGAEKAHQLLGEAARIIAAVDGSFQGLQESMDAIVTSGEETQKIIRVIDGIAFQTKLLALNAAIEAARAGAAGDAFAVVAEELRNLSARAAEAARSTSQLIESNVERVKVGRAALDRVRSEYGSVALAVGESADLADRITRSSHERSNHLAAACKCLENLRTGIQGNAVPVVLDGDSMDAFQEQWEDLCKHIRQLSALVGCSGGERFGMPKGVARIGRGIPLTASRPEDDPPTREGRMPSSIENRISQEGDDRKRTPRKKILPP